MKGVENATLEQGAEKSTSLGWLSKKGMHEMG